MTTARARLQWLLPYVFIGVVALLPRVLDLGIFVTHDEAEFWLSRSEQFLLALQSGNVATMPVTTHPGVTTMWLGLVGILLRRVLRAWGVVQEVPFPLLLALMQLPAALVHSIGVVMGYALLRRMLPAITALLAALLWAADPFVIGYSRLLHVDALAGTFATLSLLAACVYWNHAAQRRWLVLSGICAALAVLSKSPALAVVPVVGVLALAQGRWRTPRRWLLPLLAWGVVFAGTVVVVWPAVWAAPSQVYHALRAGVEVEGAQPHMTGNFFLGHIDPSPGLLFYPVALVLRTTPWTLAGVLLLAVALLRRQTPNHRDIAVLTGFILLFTIGLSLFPKKFNRYLVPSFPPIDVLAAIGVVWGAERLSWLLARAADVRFWLLNLFLQQADFYYLARPPQASPLHVRRISGVLVGMVGVVAVVNAGWWHPYSIAAFNQVLGGAPAGARTFSIGWGEGFDQVAAWLNQQTDITGVETASIMVKSLNPYLRHGAQATTPETATLPATTGYVVVYIYQAQGTVFPPFDQFYGHAQPAHTVTIHGVDYAWVYQVGPAVAHARVADFGADIHLRGFDVQGTVQPGEQILFRLFWQTRGAPGKDYWLFAHLVGAAGQRVVQLDVPYTTGAWGAHRFVTTELPVQIPAGTPAGSYQLLVGLYDPSNGARLPLDSPATADPAIDGADVLLLQRVEVEERLVP